MYTHNHLHNHYMHTLYTRYMSPEYHYMLHTLHTHNRYVTHVIVWWIPDVMVWILMSTVYVHTMHVYTYIMELWRHHPNHLHMSECTLASATSHTLYTRYMSPECYYTLYTLHVAMLLCYTCYIPDTARCNGMNTYVSSVCTHNACLHMFACCIMEL